LSSALKYAAELAKQMKCTRNPKCESEDRPFASYRLVPWEPERQSLNNRPTYERKYGRHIPRAGRIPSPLRPVPPRPGFIMPRRGAPHAHVFEVHVLRRLRH
jgi:hypothetical protein